MPPAARPESNNPHGTGRYIPILDGWRAVAILLVIAFHSFFNTDNTGHPLLHKVAEVSGRTGALGVLIFFCISGFLITQRLLAESEVEGRISLGVFYIRRAFRILPPVTAYLLVILALSLAGVIQLSVYDWSAPLFVENYFPGSWFTTHFWSLSVEEHFYLFWPLCIALAGWRRAMWVGVALVVAVGFVRPWELHHSAHPPLVLWHTETRLDYLMMGCVLAIALHFHPSVKGWLVKFGSPLGLCLLFVALVVTIKVTVVDLRSVQALILTLMVCGSAVAEAPLCKALLANRPILFIGKISYSLYVWQQLFLGTYSRAVWALPVKLGLAFTVAVLSYNFLERPFIRYGRRLAEKRAQPAVVPA